MSSYDPKHANGSCLNPGSIEISLAEIKSDPGEVKDFKFFDGDNFPYRVCPNRVHIANKTRFLPANLGCYSLRSQ